MAGSVVQNPVAADTTAGNIVFYAIGQEGGSTTPAPTGAGWELLFSVPAAGNSLLVYWRQESAPTAPSSFGHTGDGFIRTLIVEVTGITPTDVTTPAVFDTAAGAGMLPALDISGSLPPDVLGMYWIWSAAGMGGGLDFLAWAGPYSGASIPYVFSVSDLSIADRIQTDSGVGSGAIFCGAFGFGGAAPGAFWTNLRSASEEIG